MHIKNYLKDRWLLFVGWVVFVLLTAFVLWLAPNLQVDWGTLLYLALLEALVLTSFLVGDYLYKKRWWKKLQSADGESTMQNYLTGARTEEEKVQQRYINQLIREHQEAMQQVVVNQQEQKDYIDSWVHEIKVPLAASQLLLRSIEFDIPDDKYMQLENELAKIDEYVEQVLYYARLDSFSKDYLIQESSLKEIIQPIIRSQANYFIQKNIHFSVEGEDQTVLTDAKWIGFIFRQLLTNALKYTPTNGKVLILLKKEQQGITLQMKDNGIGIPEEDLRRIFDKGFTGSNGRYSETHSTGLGLYLAKNLAEQLGVELTATSTVGQGTTMNLFFPVLSFFQEQK